MNPETRAAILEQRITACRADWASLKKCSKAHVVSEFHRLHRVADSRGASKTDLICSILEARYGRKVLNTAFA